MSEHAKSIVAEYRALMESKDRCIAELEREKASAIKAAGAERLSVARLRAEVAELKRERDEAMANAANMLARNGLLRAELKAARAALREAREAVDEFYALDRESAIAHLDAFVARVQTAVSTTSDETQEPEEGNCPTCGWPQASGAWRDWHGATCPDPWHTV